MSEEYGDSGKKTVIHDHLIESTGFCLLTIARTWTDENIYTDVNSQYLQNRVRAAHSVNNTQLRTRTNSTFTFIKTHSTCFCYFGLAGMHSSVHSYTEDLIARIWSIFGGACTLCECLKKKNVLIKVITPLNIRESLL